MRACLCMCVAQYLELQLKNRCIGVFLNTVIRKCNECSVMYDINVIILQV